jgi:hypothetical protein
MGVGINNRKNLWQARILYHGKTTHLGYYKTEVEAARVFDRWAGQGCWGIVLSSVNRAPLAAGELPLLYVALAGHRTASTAARACLQWLTAVETS